MTENGKRAKKRLISIRVSDVTYEQLQWLARADMWGTQTAAVAIAIDRMFRGCSHLGEDGREPSEVALA
jgi:hypothetical protein